MKESAKISIIVPIYRVEQYLRRCVDSILAQTYQNLEIILVDDGSPDKCPQICDEYAQKDERIRVIHQTNKGQSDARNAGLEICTGDYIGFVDSDDWISQTMYAELLGVIEKYGAQLAYCGLKVIDENSGICIEGYDHKTEKVLPANLFLYDTLSREHENVSVCNKLYAASVFREVRFPSGRIYEDAAILCKTVERIEYVACTGTAGYYYLSRAGSTMHSGVAERHCRALQPILSEYKEFVQEKYPQYMNAYYCYEVSTISLIVTFYDSQHESSDQGCRKLRHRLWKYLPYYVFNRNTRNKNKIAYIMTAAHVFLPAQKLLHTVRRIYRRG